MITIEQLKKANENLEKVPIKGKPYALVNTRVKAFREICPSGVITTEIVSLEDGIVTMRASIMDEAGNLISTGYAQEKETNGYINKTSFIENCETSAVGRALGFAGIGIDESMASAEEVANAILNQNKTKDNAYPSQEDMRKAIEKRYEDDPENKAALLKHYDIKDLKDLADAQVMVLYNKMNK